MDIKTYLPDALGARAKEANLPFSQLLRDAVIDELERRRIVSETLAEPTEHLLEVQHPDGYAYTGRITGKLIHEGSDRVGSFEIYLTGDQRVLRHNCDGSIDETTLEELAAEDNPAAYIDVAVALGEKPIVDL